MATTLGTHCVVGTGVHCNNMLKHIYLFIYLLLLLLLLLLLFEYCFLFLHIPSCELTILKAMRIAIDTFQLIRALWSGTSPFLDVFYSILLILQAKKALIRLRELDCAVHKRVDVTFSLGWIVLSKWTALLIFTTVWTSLADDKLIFFLIFRENRLWHFMQISPAWNVKPIFSEK